MAWMVAGGRRHLRLRDEVNTEPAALPRHARRELGPYGARTVCG